MILPRISYWQWPKSGQVDYLVTGDKAGLLGLGRHHVATILTARAFLDVLRA